ncbi:MAG: hypothetical protein OQK12_17605 [Motiliproteus sp.]|nr:hypothetical protein [Motiliproteus sp.]MCW9054153.1 hypothetical protein [Motiliproteus sp.]
MTIYREHSRVQVEVNGQVCQLPTGSTLEYLIEKMALADYALKVAHNFGAISRRQCAHRLLQEGDNITIYRD